MRPTLPSIDWLEFRWLAFVAVLCIGTGVLVWYGVPVRVSLLITFDLTASVYLIGMIRAMLRTGSEIVRRHARSIDAGRRSLLTISLVLSATVLAALGVEIQAAEDVAMAHVFLASASVFVSWLFMNTMFAMHYAHSYYEQGRSEPGGLAFPGGDSPEYLDFLYFALMLGMTFQVSDVSIVDRGIRRVAMLHAVFAFFFNVIVISIAVSTLAAMME
jgi:uncharacterized membrane protein